MSTGDQKLDEFESMFRSALSDVFHYQRPTMKTVALVTDTDEATTERAANERSRPSWQSGQRRSEPFRTISSAAAGRMGGRGRRRDTHPARKTAADARTGLGGHPPLQPAGSHAGPPLHPRLGGGHALAGPTGSRAVASGSRLPGRTGAQPRPGARGHQPPPRRRRAGELGGGPHSTWGHPVPRPHRR